MSHIVCAHTLLSRVPAHVHETTHEAAGEQCSHNLPRATGARRVVSTAERHSGRAMHHGSRALTRPATGIASAWHPHALVRAAFDDFDLDRRGLRGRYG